MNPTSNLIRLEAHLQSKFRDVLKQEEILWFQKSREEWIKFGDCNTTYFHTHTMTKQRRNTIHTLMLDLGTWCCDVVVLKDEAKKYFQKSFLPSHGSIF